MGNHEAMKSVKILLGIVFGSLAGGAGNDGATLEFFGNSFANNLIALIAFGLF